LRADPALALGLNAHAGSLTNVAVAEAHGLESRALDDVLAYRDDAN
jgi:alanine dehydrogenase